MTWDLHHPPHPPVPPHHPCPQKPGTVFRLFLPPGFVINLLNLIEVTSPSGICLIVRIPILGAQHNQLFDSIRAAGGTVDFVG